MKKLYPLVFSLTSLMGNADFVNATVHIINAEGTTIATDIFIPSAVNAVCGDTVKWVWVSGFHTTSSSSVPNGATLWNALLDANNLSFSYVVTVAGTYQYTCHPGTTPHMDGTITVTCGSAVPSISIKNVSSAYPNPFSDRFTIETPPQADMIIISNLLGEKIKSFSVRNRKAEVDAAGLNKGIYFYSIMKEGEILETRKIIKN